MSPTVARRQERGGWIGGSQNRAGPICATDWPSNNHVRWDLVFVGAGHRHGQNSDLVADVVRLALARHEEGKGPGWSHFRFSLFLALSGCLGFRFRFCVFHFISFSFSFHPCCDQICPVVYVLRPWKACWLLSSCFAQIRLCCLALNSGFLLWWLLSGGIFLRRKCDINNSTIVHRESCFQKLLQYTLVEQISVNWKRSKTTDLNKFQQDKPLFHVALVCSMALAVKTSWPGLWELLTHLMNCFIIETLCCFVFRFQKKTSSLTLFPFLIFNK